MCVAVPVQKSSYTEEENWAEMPQPSWNPISGNCCERPPAQLVALASENMITQINLSMKNFSNTENNSKMKPLSLDLRYSVIQVS